MEIGAIVSELERRDLTDFFRQIASKGGDGREFFLSPRSLEEREQLKILEGLGVVNVETGEFRWNHVTAEIKSSELFCQLSEAGMEVAVALESVES